MNGHKEKFANEGKESKPGFLSHLGKRGIIIWILIFAIAGAFLLWIGGDSGASNTNKDLVENLRLEEYSKSLETKIADLCSKVKGVSNVSVSVYLDSGFETIYAYDEERKSSSSGSNSEKKYVTVGNGNNETMVTIAEKMPNICGIAIVCGGGGHPAVAKELIGLVSSAYGIPTNKIYIAEGKNKCTGVLNR